MDFISTIIYDITGIDTSNIISGPVFGTTSEDTSSGLTNSAYASAGFKQPGAQVSLLAYQKIHETGAHAKVLGYVPILGTFIAYKRVQLVKNNQLLTAAEKIAHYIRAFFEAIPVLGLLLIPIDIAVDKYIEWTTKNYNIFTRNS